MITPDMMLKRMARTAILKVNGDTEQARDAFNKMVIDANDAALERELCNAYRNTAIRAVLATHYQELRSEGKLPALLNSTPVKTTDHDKIIEKPRRPSDWQWDNKTGMTAEAHIHRYLETFIVNGKPIGDCTVEEVDAAADHKEVDARFMRRLVEGLPPHVLVRDHRTDTDAHKIWQSVHSKIEAEIAA